MTFGDMMSLLLTFFILLLSFAEMEMERFEAYSGAVKEAFGVQSTTPVFGQPQASEVLASQYQMEASQSTMFNGLKSVARRHSSRGAAHRLDIELHEGYRGIVLSVRDQGLFEPGRAEIHPSAWPFLDDVLEIAARHKARVQVEAHTDSTPIRSSRYPSNDHLAGARAVSIVRYFASQQPDRPPDWLGTVPAGSSHPLRPNFNEANRRRNRRLEIIFSRPEVLH